MTNDHTQESIDDRKMNDLEIDQMYFLGYAKYGSGLWDEAAEIFQLLCTRKPLEQKYWFALGASLQQKASYTLALNAWAMCALLSPLNPYPHFHAAECALSLEQIDDAKVALENAKSRIQENDHPLIAKIELLQNRNA
jgi:type III secretion system low calcium response chaperone LcrH/SycD